MGRGGREIIKCITSERELVARNHFFINGIVENLTMIE